MYTKQNWITAGILALAFTQVACHKSENVNVSKALVVASHPITSDTLSGSVSGTLLAELDFAGLDESSRRTLFHRLGRTLRLLERQGLSQYDSKMSNWIVVDDEKLGPVPVMIDVDGIRKIVPPLWPIDRLLRSLREHKQYTPEDSRWVCVGYAPHGKFVREHQ